MIEILLIHCLKNLRTLSKYARFMQPKDDLNYKIVILIPYLGWDGTVKKSESRYYPFKAAMMKGEGGAEMVVRQEEVGVGGGTTRGSIVCTI
jgi:hypothetical protein